MEQFENAELVFVTFDSSDIITTSNGGFGQDLPEQDFI